MDFKDKVVLITGGVVGMGRVTAVEFAAKGAKVAVNYSRSEKEAKETVDIIEKAGGGAIALQGDVSKPADADRIVAETVKRFGRIDILVNNAGTTNFIAFDDLDAATADVWLKLYSVNVVGAFQCARAAAKEMKKTGGGVIINNASVSGQRPNGSSIPYCCTKAAMLHMTRCLAVTLGPDIRVNSVSPGFIADTRWHGEHAGYDPERARVAETERSVVKRVGTSEDIANAILFLASDKSTFCTGIDILVDGGRFYKV